MLGELIVMGVFLWFLLFLFEQATDLLDSWRDQRRVERPPVPQSRPHARKPPAPRSRPLAEKPPVVSKEQFDELLQAAAVAVSWKADCERAVAEAVERGRWFDREAKEVLESRRPDKGLLKKVTELRVLHRFTDAEQEAMRFLSSDLGRLVASTNQKIEANELLHRKSFFQSIEKTPLTEEQAKAVVCYDNRVHVVAAAGSGKTSVMVARAAYGISRGFVQPSEVLLLAFNTAAAAELEERVKTRFDAAGIASAGVKASTFHSLGLSVIGQASGKKPRLAPWVETEAAATKKILTIVQNLGEEDPSFLDKWNLYRLVYAGAPLDVDGVPPNKYDPDKKASGYSNLEGTIVRSYGEVMISNWLFLNGVNYEYERPYQVDTADVDHSYHPDFYYPDIDVWHEHWGLDRHGNPPKAWTNYRDGMKWKRKIHRQYNTTLIESTYDEIVNRGGLEALGKELTQRGIDLDFNPNRIPPNHPAPSDEALARVIRVFMAHVKSNSLTKADIQDRLQQGFGHLRGSRAEAFLSIYWRIHDAWNAELQSKQYHDF